MLQLKDPEEICKWNSSIYEIGKQIIAIAKSENLYLKFFGGCAVWSLNSKYHDFICKQKRVIKDIDFFSKSEHKKDLSKILTKNNFIKESSSSSVSYLRDTYLKDKVKIEIYYNNFTFAQKVELRDSEEYYYTLTLATLFLTKLQIMNMTTVDYIDCIVIVMELSNCSDPLKRTEENILLNNISGNWQLYHSVEKNINNLIDFIASFPLPIDMNLAVYLGEMLKKMNNSKKTLSWKLRNLFGEKLKWYNEIN